MAKKSTKIVIYSLLVMVVVALVAIPKLMNSGNDKKKEKGGGDKNKIIPAEAIIARADTLVNSFLTTGSLMPDEVVSLKPEIAGKLIRINFREGQRIGGGALLAKLNDADLQAQLKKAEQKLDLLVKIDERQKILLQNKNISQEDYEKSASDLEIQKTEIELIKAQIAKTEIRAPFGGIIGLRKFSNGAFVSPTDEITTVQKTDIIKVDFSVPQKFSSGVKPGTKIAFYMPPDRKKYEAEIYASEPNINEASRSLELRAKIRNTKNMLLPGTFVEVEIGFNKSDKSVMIPSQALIPDLKSEKVYVYSNGIAKPVNVKTGIRSESQVEIINGISIGDTIISSGIIQLKPGAKVKLTKIN
jgi:membrane fusion protein, multidrug efflux system